jgi:hypothetical protein
MKTKLILLTLVAVTLLSFKLMSTSRPSKNRAVAGQETKEVKATQGGFALQDSNQF